MSEQDKHKIDELQKEIYQRDFESPLPPTRQHFSEHKVDVDPTWHHEGDPQDSNLPPKPPRIVAGAFFRKVLTVSFIFFIISAGLLLYMFFGGWNIISANNVNLTFLGPYTVSAGDELSFDIVIDNQNRSAITNAVLYIDYPDGTKQASDITADLHHDKQEVGEVASRMTSRKTAKSVLFGEINSKKEIKVTLEYGLNNSNATYKKEKTYDVTIGSTPLTVTVSHPPRLISGDPVDVTTTVTSNSKVPLTNILLRVDYPFGFGFTSGDPKPTFENNIWLIPSLNPGESQDFTFHGTLQGEQGDERVFKISVGTQDPTNEKNIAVRYLADSKSTFIQKTPLAVSLLLEGSSDATYITEQGKLVQGSVTITNNLPVRVTDAKIQLALSGPLFDPTSVQAPPGFFQSLNNSIIWDKSVIPELADLEPGETYTAVFTFSTYSPERLSIRNGKMSLNATVTGRQAAQSELLSYSQAKTIQTRTSVGVLSQITYSTGPFRNRGPMPPKVDTPTTYTVTLSATNSSNDVRAAEVRAQLPIYVKWMEATSPASEPITWIQEKNEVIWRVGDMAAGTGFTKPARQVSFQIQLIPSLSQVGSAPDLVQNITINAIDSYTSAALSGSTRNLTTRMTNDPQYKGQEADITN